MRKPKRQGPVIRMSGPMQQDLNESRRSGREEEENSDFPSIRLQRNSKNCSAARHRNAQSPYRVVSFQHSRRPLISAKRASLSEQTLTNMFQCTRMAVSASPTPQFAFFFSFFKKKEKLIDIFFNPRSPSCQRENDL